jgi:hypothetical protein
MTEQAFAFGSPGGDEDAGTNRRPMMFAIGAGILVLIVAAYFLLFSGGGDDEAFAPIQRAKAPAAKSAAKKPAAKTPVAKPATFTDVTSRDPFKPEIAPPPPEPVTPPVTAPVPGSTGVTPGYPTMSQSVRLLDVTDTAAKVDVNGTQYTVVRNKPFATSYQLVEIQGTKCATFLYGDRSFDLCEGNTYVHSA